MQVTLGGELPLHPVLITVKLMEMGCSDPENPRTDEDKEAQELVLKYYLTMLALGGVNKQIFQGMKDCPENSLLFGQELYPKTWEQLLNRMNNFKPEVVKV